MFVDICAGIVELILDVRQIGSRAAHQVGIALSADREDHRLGVDFAAALQPKREIALLALDLDDFGAQLDIGNGDLAVPQIKDRLALARIESEVRAQHQLAGRRHHMLALLVFEDRVAVVVRLFEQHMRQIEGGGMRGGAQSGGSGTDNRDANARFHPVYLGSGFPADCLIQGICANRRLRR